MARRIRVDFGMKQETKNISKEEFEKLPATTKLNEMLDFFKENENTAFHFENLKKEFELSKSQLYQQLRNLINTKLIEQRGMYYILK